MNRYDVLRSEASADTLAEALGLPIGALLGVSETAASQLESHGIQSVFDLAASALFAEAALIVEAADHNGRLIRADRAPGDLIDKGTARGPLAELADKPISVLRRVGAKRAKELEQALDVKTLRELAHWPPYETAKQLFNAAYGLVPSDGDSEAPPELLPRAGDLPTERVQYDTVLLERFLSAETPRRDGRLEMAGMAELRHVDGPLARDAAGQELEPLEEAGMIDVATAASDAFGFTAPAIGALATFTQSWYPHGLSLGQLLHTVALAPGESTRIAMIDWSRRSRAGVTEIIGESEFLTADLERSRSISEVTSAVAFETQYGKSESESMGAAIGHGYGSGAAATGSYQGINFAAAAGQALGLSAGASKAKSWSLSTGLRALGASMTQNITDRTHQSANSVRNRRATIVREVSQSESERITTRTVTNYNHMHALSIEYYEIVQVYRVAVELGRVTPCLFVPMRRIDFRRPGVVARFRGAIAASGLTPGVRAIGTTEPDSLLVAAPHRSVGWRSDILLYLADMFGQPVGQPDDTGLVFPLRFGVPAISTNEEAPLEAIIMEEASGQVLTFPIEEREESDVDPFGLYRAITNPYAPYSEERSIYDVVRIRVRKRAGEEEYGGPLTFATTLMWAGPDDEEPTGGLTEGMVHMYVDVDVPAGVREFTLFEFARTPSSADLFSHLEENALYYSQAIWETLDSATVALLLSHYSLGRRPLVELVDPTPVAVAGNYLVFRYPSLAQTTEWADLISERGLVPGTASEDVVPLPSGGVFAEAVLGRFNSAEKLDITRFWNWQDSPIPIPPPEIAAIAAGSRAQTEDLEPGQLSAPVLNIQNAPSLPDPQGLTAALSALASGSMFRDMSGLAGTQQLAESALAGAFETAARMAEQAGSNAATAASLLGGGGSRPTFPATASRAGARINEGERLDRERGFEGTPSDGSDGIGAANGGAGLPTTGSYRGDAFYADLGGAPVSPEIMLAGGRGARAGGSRGGAGATPAGAEGGLAATAVEKGMDLVMKLLEKPIEKLFEAPTVTVLAPENDSAVLLAGYEDVSDYLILGEGLADVHFTLVGAGLASDGLNGRLRVTWRDCALRREAVKNADLSRADRLSAVMCKQRIRFDFDGVAEGIEEARLTARMARGLITAGARTWSPLLGWVTLRDPIEANIQVQVVDADVVLPDTMTAVIPVELRDSPMDDPVWDQYFVREDRNAGGRLTYVPSRSGGEVPAGIEL